MIIVSSGAGSRLLAWDKTAWWLYTDPAMESLVPSHQETGTGVWTC